MYQLQAISDMIVDAGLGVVGVNLFLYHSPAKVQECIILYPSNDPPMIDPELPKYFKAKFQTIVRSNEHDTGFALCKNLEETLTQFNVELPTMSIRFIRPLYQPRVYRRSDSGALEFSITYEVRFVDKT